jgi:hypothetical protein
MFHASIGRSEIPTHGIVVYQVTKCIQRATGNNSKEVFWSVENDVRRLCKQQKFASTYKGANSRKVPMKADMNAPLEARTTRTNRTVAAGSIERLVSLVGSMDREVSSSLLNDIPKELPCKSMLRRPCRFLVVLLGSTENLRCGKRMLLCSMVMSPNPRNAGPWRGAPVSSIRHFFPRMPSIPHCMTREKQAPSTADTWGEQQYFRCDDDKCTVCLGC